MSQAQTLSRAIHGLLLDIDGSLSAADVTYEGLVSLVKNWRDLKEAASALPPDTFRPLGLALAEAGLRKLANSFAQAVGDAEADEASQMELVEEAETALGAAKAKLALAQAATKKAHEEIKGLGTLLG